MTIFLVSAAAILAGIFDLYPKIKAKKTKECWITGVLLAASLAIVILVDLNMRPPSPWQPLVDLAMRLYGGTA